MNYLRKLLDPDLRQAFSKSCLVLCIAWLGLFGIHALVSMLFWNSTVFLCFFLATVAWGTHINYRGAWKVEQTDTSLSAGFRPKDEEKGEE